MTNQSYIQKFSALRALICYELLRISEEKLMKNQRYTWKIFPRCARQFDQNVIKVNFFKRIMTQFCQDLRKTRNTLFAAFFPGPRSPDYLQHRFNFKQRNEPCKLWWKQRKMNVIDWLVSIECWNSKFVSIVEIWTVHLCCINTDFRIPEIILQSF